MISRTEAVILSPSDASCALSAVSRAVELARTPVDNCEVADVAAACPVKEISAATITEPAVSVRLTALVDTPASSASTVLMEVCAAAL